MERIFKKKNEDVPAEKTEDNNSANQTKNSSNAGSKKPSKAIATKSKDAKQNANSNAKAKPNAKSDANGNAKTDANPKTATKANPKSKQNARNANAKTKANSKDIAKAGKAKANSKDSAKAKANVKAKANTNANAKAKAKQNTANTNSKANAKTNANANAKTNPKAKQNAGNANAASSDEKPAKKPRFTRNQKARNAGAANAVQLGLRNGGAPNPKTVKIIPLGGLEQIGMNITAIEYGDDIIIIDGGMSFPENDMLGIDLVIPDITYLKDNADKVRAMVVTHGHEDHIGAIPYIEREMNIPLYATRLTMGLIDYKLTEHGLIDQVERHVAAYGDTFTFGSFKVEFIRTNHSIADAAALAIFTPAGLIVHTGDFKVDYTPVFGDSIDLQRFGELGRMGVLALMADSTNVERPGYTPSEKTVGKTFDHIFDDYRDNRLIIATFASNVDRVQQIINSAYKYGRKVIVDGRSMVKIITIAQELGYISVPENTLIDIDEGKNYPSNQLVYVTTGSQGENMAALSRIASSIHQKIKIQPNDVVVFSSNPIPGNEKPVSNVINELEMKGAHVIWHDTHVSGHACQEELKLIYSLTKPMYAIPVHGEYRHLKRHAELAREMGIPKERIKILMTGDVLDIGETKFDVTGKVPAAGVLVDGLGVGDVGNIVLRDRQHLSQNGLIVVSMTINRMTNELVAGPDIVSRGFVYVREAESLIEGCYDVVQETMDICMERNITDWSKIKMMIKDSLGEFLWQRMKRSPMILPIISEV